jgi:lipopolysaccharide/colanic/teichoic acid biosynthesis glycosyltransferase
MRSHETKTAPNGVAPGVRPNEGVSDGDEEISGGRALALMAWRKLRRPLFLFGLCLGDAISPIMALTIAYELRFGSIPFAAPWGHVIAESGTQLVLLVTMAAHVFLMRQMGLYRLHKTWLPFDFILRLGLVEGVTLLVFVACARGFMPDLSTRMLVGYFFLVLWAVTIGLKLSARAVVLLMLCFNIGVKKVVIVGSTETARRLQRAFQQHPQLGYHLIGLLHRGGNESTFDGAAHARVQVGSATQVFERLLRIWPDVVIIAMSARKSDEMLNLIAQCTAHGIDVRLVPEFFEVYSSGMQVDRIGITPMVHLRSLRVPLLGAWVKRSLDLTLAVCALPLLGLAVFVLRPRAVRQDAPLFTKTQRVGMNGRPFDLYRFNRALWKRDDMEDRPWVIVLPQLVNVLKGHMSLVGPRAGDPERAAHYNSWEKRMLAVRPGLMGFTEANECVEREDASGQMAWDIGYLDQQSAAFDLNVVLTSIPRLFTRRACSQAGTGTEAKAG